MKNHNILRNRWPLEVVSVAVSHLSPLVYQMWEDKPTLFNYYIGIS